MGGGSAESSTKRPERAGLRGFSAAFRAGGHIRRDVDGGDSREIAGSGSDVRCQHVLLSNFGDAGVAINAFCNEA